MELVTLVLKYYLLRSTSKIYKQFLYDNIDPDFTYQELIPDITITLHLSDFPKLRL
jgi:hypothetical protein